MAANQRGCQRQTMPSKNKSVCCTWHDSTVASGMTAAWHCLPWLASASCQSSYFSCRVQLHLDMLDACSNQVPTLGNYKASLSFWKSAAAHYQPMGVVSTTASLMCFDTCRVVRRQEQGGIVAALQFSGLPLDFEVRTSMCCENFIDNTQGIVVDCPIILCTQCHVMEEAQWH